MSTNPPATPLAAAFTLLDRSAPESPARAATATERAAAPTDADDKDADRQGRVYRGDRAHEKQRGQQHPDNGRSNSVE